MENSGKRVDRSERYRERRWVLIAGLGAIVASVAMLGSAVASPINSGVVIGPAYKGVSEPENVQSTTGCAGSTKLTDFKYSLASGTLTGLATGRAKGCGKSLPSQDESVASDQVGVDSAFIHLPALPSKTSKITASFSGNYGLTLSADDGGTGACHAPLNYAFDNDTVWEWNWTGSSFGDYAYVSTYDLNGAWSNVSYNVVSIPSPFNLNNTTLFDHYEFSEYYGECASEASIEFWSQGYLYNAVNQSTIPDSGSSLPYYGFTELTIANEIDFGWTNSSTWDGPYLINNTHPTAPFNDNTSLSSDVQSYGYSTTSAWNSYAPGANNSQTYTNTTTFSGDTMWWIGPFSSTAKYYLEFDIYFIVTAFQECWPNATSSFNLNLHSPGSGIKLVSVSLK